MRVNTAQRWEYLSTTQDLDLGEDACSNETMAEHAIEGWELVVAFPISVGKHTGSIQYIFKREVEQERRRR